jgi:hypothetical protein
MTMEIWEVIARESVRDLITRYNSNGDAARWDQLEQLFSPTALMDIDGVLYQGRAAIMGMFRATKESAVDQHLDAQNPLTHTTMAEWVARGNKPFVRHLTSTTQIDVANPTEATARSYYFVLTVHGLDHWGRYFDDFACINGQWLFVRRQHVLDAAIEGGWASRGPNAIGRTVRALGVTAP